MKFKFKHEVEQEMDIDFPVYLSWLDGVAKIESPDSFIKARATGGEFLIEKIKGVPNCTLNMILNGKSISKQQFTIGYEKAMSHIVREAFMQSTEPATEQDKKESQEEINERSEEEVYETADAFEE